MFRAVKPAATRIELAANRLRRWWPWLLVSLLIHLPLTPLGPVLGLLGLVMRLNHDIPDEPVENLEGIPVELLSSPQPDEAPPPVAADLHDEPVSAVAATKKPKPQKPKRPELPDAGAPDASVPDAGTATELDAGLNDAGTGDAGIADAGSVSADAGVPTDAGTPTKDPFAIAGDFPTPPKANVNVKIHLFASALAKHPAGAAISALLSSEPQWQDFLGPGGLDPIGDFSRIAIYGPQLVDSSKVAIVLEYSGEATGVQTAVEALVKRTDGAHWTTENKKRIAYVKAAGADRVIIFFPGKLIAIVPPGPVAKQLVAWKRLPALAEPSSASEVFQGSLKTPHRVQFFRRIGVELPQSIAEARAFISTLPNGGASIRLELADESPEAAKAHIDDLERQVSALTLGLVSLHFKTEGGQIVVETKLSPIQLTGIFVRLKSEIAALRGRAGH